MRTGSGGTLRNLHLINWRCIRLARAGHARRAAAPGRDAPDYQPSPTPITRPRPSADGLTERARPTAPGRYLLKPREVDPLASPCCMARVVAVKPSWRSTGMRIAQSMFVPTEEDSAGLALRRHVPGVKLSPNTSGTTPGLKGSEPDEPRRRGRHLYRRARGLISQHCRLRYAPPEHGRE